MSIGKIESFCIDPTETVAFVGTLTGQIVAINIDDFKKLHVVTAHSGGIQAIVCHQSLPYVAALSTDRTVSVWSYKNGLKRELHRILRVSVRDLRPFNDHSYIPPVHSTSQALGFHDKEKRFVTRTGNAGVLEVAFSEDGSYDIITCVRLHHDSDLISARYAHDSDLLLTGSIDGSFVLSLNGSELSRWDIGNNVHWAEFISGTTYLLASDRRCVVRLDISGSEDTVIGEAFTRDDLEHVTYNHKSRRAYVGSFDRRIYEIHTDTCVPIRTVFHAPFKCRWVKTLDRDPSLMLVQCRNGGLYKVDCENSKYLDEIKETRPALWTGVSLPTGDLLLSGEGPHCVTIKQGSPLPLDSWSNRFHQEKVQLDLSPDTYTKRMAFHHGSSMLILGRTNGDIVLVHDAAVVRTVNVSDAVRDLVVTPHRLECFAASEDGRVYRVDLETGTVSEVFRSEDQPIWGLAYNVERDLLVAAERTGQSYILEVNNNFSVLHRISAARSKRLKWIDSNSLLYNKRDELFRFDLDSRSETQLIAGQGNTIEDFIWDEEKRYLVLIGYTCNVTLCDFSSGFALSCVPDQVDYSKGVLWLSSSRAGDGQELDFVTFGRSGSAHRFRIHDEKLLALGPIL